MQHTEEVLLSAPVFAESLPNGRRWHSSNAFHMVRTIQELEIRGQIHECYLGRFLLRFIFFHRFYLLFLTIKPNPRRGEGSEPPHRGFFITIIHLVSNLQLRQITNETELPQLVTLVTALAF